MNRAPRSHFHALLVALGGLFLVAGSPALAQDAAAPAAAPPADATAAVTIPNEKCFKCHDDPEMTAEADGRSMAVIEAQFKTGAHKRLDCVACHTTALTIKHPRNELGPVSFDACMECHEDEINPFQASVHAKVKGGKPVTCQGCHGNIHTTPRSNDPTAPMSDVNQVRNCGACHEDMMEGYLSSVHARALFISGLTEVSPACSDCHGSHDIQRHDAEGARTSHARSPETCGECHKGVLKEWDESAHGDLPRGACRRGPEDGRGTRAHADRLRQLPRRSLQVLPRQLPRQVGQRWPPERGHVLRLPHAAPQPAGERPALEHAP